MKKFLLVLSFLLLSNNAFALTTPTLVQVDPTGTGNYTITGIAEFDWYSFGNLAIEDELVSSTSSATTLNDWLQVGNVGTTATFDIHSHAQLGSYIFYPGGGDASGLILDDNTDMSQLSDYEITATLDGQETALLTLNTNGNLELVFLDISGTFQYYLDVTPDSDAFSGVGFNSGDPTAADPFLEGTLDAVSGSFEILTLGEIGGGSNDIASTITYYNSNYINTDPASAGVFLEGSEFETTVEYRGFFSPNPPIIGDDPYTMQTGDLMLIADSNTTFTAIPEPATSLLIGIGLLGIAAVSRKKIS